MTSPISLRPATLDDVDALTAMLDACTRAYVDRGTDAAGTRARLTMPGCDLATDSFLAENGAGQALGFGQAWTTSGQEVKVFARVHPDARGRGLGTLLLRTVLAAAHRKADGVGWSVTATTWARDPGAAEVLRVGGLREVRHFLRMVVDLPAPVPDTAPPVGLRAYRPGEDDDELYAASTAAFVDHWGSESIDAERWWWDERDSPDSGYDPTLWAVVEVDGVIAGHAIARVKERGGRSEGYVSEIGVRPEWRGRGIAQGLLRHLFAEFTRRGLQIAALDVDADNTTSALRLYRSVGMASEPSFTAWSAPLGD
jgi:mycothiol synthase